MSSIETMSTNNTSVMSNASRLKSIRLQIFLTELLLELHNDEELRPLIKHITATTYGNKFALTLFNLYYFTQYLTFPFSLAQIEFIYDLQRLTSNNTVDELSTLMAIGARGVAKTTLTTTALTYMLCYNLTKYIVIASSSTQNSSEYLYEARSTLLANKAIIRDFGRLASRERVDKETGIINRQRAEDFIANNKLKTRLESISTNESLRGRLYDKSRPTFFLADDVETVQTVRSQIVTEQIKQQLQEAENAMSHNPKIVTLGNKLTNDGNVAYFESKYEKMRNDKFKTITMKIHSWDTKFTNLSSEAEALNELSRKHIEAQHTSTASSLRSTQASASQLLPIHAQLNMQSVEDIENRNDSFTFQAEYLCEPVTNILALFKPEYFTHLDNRPHPATISHILIAIDGALSLKTTADFTAITAMYHNPTNARKVEDPTDFTKTTIQYAQPIPVEVLLHARITPDQLFQAITSINQSLRNEYPLASIVWGVEEMMASQAFRPFFEQKHKHINLIPIKPKIKNKEDRIIKNLLYRYETQKIAHVVDTNEYYKELEYTLLRFPFAKHDDAPDSLSMVFDPTLQNFLLSSDSETVKYIKPYATPHGLETTDAFLKEWTRSA